MNIGIDGRALQGEKTGIGRYVFELCQELDEQLPDACFYVYSNVPIKLPISSERWVSRIDRWAYARRMKSVLWLKLRCGYLCKQDDLDIFWGSAVFLPTLPRTVRKVITVYDLNYKIVPETMGIAHRWAFTLFFRNDLARADSVITISNGSSERLRSIFGRSADAVVYPAIGKAFRPQSRNTIRDVLSEYDISHPYLLAVATWEPRKNLELLVKTFLDMKRNSLLNEQELVLAGGRGWKDQRLSKLVADAKSVVPVGYISDEKLAALYAGAEAFIFPSAYEGFGMPVLEALACGSKVVASDIPEIREAGKEYVCYVLPTPEGISKGILDVLSRFSKSEPIDVANLPTWKQEAKILKSVFDGLIQHE